MAGLMILAPGEAAHNSPVPLADINISATVVDFTAQVGYNRVVAPS